MPSGYSYQKGGLDGKEGEDLWRLGEVQLVYAREGQDFFVGSKSVLTDLTFGLVVDQMPCRLEPGQVPQRLKRRHRPANVSLPAATDPSIMVAFTMGGG